MLLAVPSHVRNAISTEIVEIATTPTTTTATTSVDRMIEMNEIAN